MLLATAFYERTVKKQRLSKALTIPERTTVYDACRRMDARRIDAVLLTDANALLSGIVTDKEIRERAKDILDDYYVVLVGDMITEEELPTYMSMLNRCDGIKDETGALPTAWATWIRAWTAEVNRHGDLLNKYLYLFSRVDMRIIEKTIQYLIASEMFSGLPDIEDLADKKTSKIPRLRKNLIQRQRELIEEFSKKEHGEEECGSPWRETTT
ncbi:hypothetical protein AgCh_004883 [Apium graveolens]